MAAFLERMLSQALKNMPVDHVIRLQREKKAYLQSYKGKIIVLLIT